MLTCPPLHRAPSPGMNTNRFSLSKEEQVLQCVAVLFFTFFFFLHWVQGSSHTSKHVAVGINSLRCVSSVLSWWDNPDPIASVTVCSAWVVLLIKMEVCEVTSCAEDIVGLWFISVLNNKKEKGSVCYKSQRTQGCFSLIPPQLSIFFLALPGTCFSLLSS